MYLYTLTRYIFSATMCNYSTAYMILKICHYYFVLCITAVEYRIYSQATKAFQALVKAFDVLSCVDIDISGDSFTSKG